MIGMGFVTVLRTKPIPIMEMWVGDRVAGWPAGDRDGFRHRFGYETDPDHRTDCRQHMGCGQPVDRRDTVGADRFMIYGCHSN